MNIKKSLSAATLVLASFALIAGCKSVDPLVGTWAAKKDQSAESFTFSPDGFFTYRLIDAKERFVVIEGFWKRKSTIHVELDWLYAIPSEKSYEYVYSQSLPGSFRARVAENGSSLKLCVVSLNDSRALEYAKTDLSGTELDKFLRTLSRS